MIAIYARVSTEEQAKHGFSLKDQIRAGRRKAQAYPGDVMDYVDEGISGELLDRPALSRLREDLRRGLIDRVICLDPDRLSRKLMNQLILSDEIEARADLVFVNGDYARTPEGQLFYQMRGAISQFEKAKINERMSRGRLEKARQGRVLRDFHIYGYNYDAIRERFVVNAREAAVVQLIFDLFTKPIAQVRGINGIASYLNERGVPAKHGGPFHRQVVRQMLMNRAYIGEFYQNKWNTEGMFANKYRQPGERVRQKQRPKDEWIQLPIPAIIDRDQFHYAGQLLAQSRRRFAGQNRHKYMLSGLLVCKDCGNTVTGRKMRNWGKEVYVYTDRKSGAGTRAENAGCKTVIPCDKLDVIVWEAVLSFAKDVESEGVLQAAAIWPVVATKQELSLATDDLKRTRLTIERLLSLLSDPDMNTETVHHKLRELTRHEQKLAEQAAELTAELETSQKSDKASKEHRRRVVHDMWQRLRTLDQRKDAQIRRELIRTVVKDIYISNHGQNIDIYTF